MTREDSPDTNLYEFWKEIYFLSYNRNYDNSPGQFIFIGASPHHHVHWGSPNYLIFKNYKYSINIWEYAEHPYFS